MVHFLKTAASVIFLSGVCSLSSEKVSIKAVVNYRDVSPQSVSDSAQEWILREKTEEIGKVINGPSAGIPSNWYCQFIFLASATLCGTECQILALRSCNEVIPFAFVSCCFLPRVPSKTSLGCGTCWAILGRYWPPFFHHSHHRHHLLE